MSDTKVHQELKPPLWFFSIGVVMVFVVVAASVGLVGLLYWGLVAVWIHGLALEEETSIAIVSVMTGLLLLCLGVYFVFRSRRTAVHTQRLHQAKTEAYEDFVSFWSTVLVQTKSETRKARDGKMAKFMEDAGGKLAMRASDDIIALYSDFCYQWNSEGKDRLVSLLSIYESIVLAMRDELGHPNNEMTLGIVMETFAPGAGELIDFSVNHKDSESEPGDMPPVRNTRYQSSHRQGSR